MGEQARGRADAYHHGNLRPALLEAADALLAEAGVDALTLRAVARRAGVSSGAPYHHFADKAALVTALARQHLDELDGLFRAVVRQVEEPQAQLCELGMVYVLYAIEHPAAFRLMFRPEKGTPFGADPAAEAVFGVLYEVVKACRAHSAALTANHEHAAIAAWSLVHGLAALLLDGPLAPLAADRERVRGLIVACTQRLDVMK